MLTPHKSYLGVQALSVGTRSLSVVADWRVSASNMTLESQNCDQEAADVLQKITGRPREEFDASEYEIPRFADQEIIVPDEDDESSP